MALFYAFLVIILSSDTKANDLDCNLNTKQLFFRGGSHGALVFYKQILKRSRSLSLVSFFFWGGGGPMGTLVFYKQILKRSRSLSLVSFNRAAL